MTIDYAPLICESESTLNTCEERLRGSPACDRVRMLRLLRSRRCRSQPEVALLLGYSPRQIRRWWALYQLSGLEGLLEYNPPGGSQSRVTAPVVHDLAVQIRSGQLVLLKEVQHYLARTYGIEYRSLQGVWDLLQRNGLALGGAVVRSPSSLTRTHGSETTALARVRMRRAAA